MGPDGCRETRETGTGSSARKPRSQFNIQNSRILPLLGWSRAELKSGPLPNQKSLFGKKKIKENIKI